jgi:FkbM family methyltransferase
MFRRIKALLLSQLARRLPWYCRISYSQFGEDIALHTLLRHLGISRGCYVDVGAYHPIRFSNTYLLYQQGWSGITIEPTPGIAAEFRAIRPRDQHLECVITPSEGKSRVPYYSFGIQSPYNTMSKEHAEEHARQSGQSFTVLELPCRTLNEILAQHLAAAERLALLSIDCEGADEAILASLDWEHYAPAVIVFEDHAADSPLSGDLAARGYQMFARMGPSVIMYRLG